jgi:hypothetical protein
MDENETLAKFKRNLCSLYGYDESLKFVGKPKSDPSATENKAFLDPNDFLAFAVEDSRALQEARSLISCLGNCKRAIDSQVDRLIRRLGFLPLARKQQWPVPKKLEFISQSGILAPKLLRSVNRLRNRLEHEYALPSTEDVEDALEIATLFVAYAELVRIPALNWSLAGKETVRYDYSQMVFHFFDQDPDDMSEREVEPIFSVPYGDVRFQGFYEFLMKNVPSMERNGRMGKDA